MQGVLPMAHICKMVRNKICKGLPLYDISGTWVDNVLCQQWYHPLQTQGVITMVVDSTLDDTKFYKGLPLWAVSATLAKLFHACSDITPCKKVHGIPPMGCICHIGRHKKIQGFPSMGRSCHMVQHILEPTVIFTQSIIFCMGQPLRSVSSTYAFIAIIFTQHINMLKHLWGGRVLVSDNFKCCNIIPRNLSSVGKLTPTHSHH